MRAILLACLFACLPHAASADVVIRDVTVLQPSTGQTLPHRTVTIRGDRITAVDPADDTPPGPGDIDGRGKFLMPGLWDVHVHLSDMGRATLPVLIASGVTSVRDMGGDIAELTAWRNAVEAGVQVGPRVKLCGPMLEAPGDQSIARGVRDHLAVDGPEEARRIVADIAARGADCVKMRSVRDLATYEALGQAAEQAGLPLTGHPPYAFDPVEFGRVRQQTFEHMFYPYPFRTLPEDRQTAIVASMLERGIRVAPSIIAWAPSMRSQAALKAEFEVMTGDVAAARFVSPRLHENWRELTEQSRGTSGWARTIVIAAGDARRMYDAGVPLLVGTDTGAPFVSPATAVHEELELMVSMMGLTPAEALRAATWVPAGLFDQQDELGSIDVGKRADLILLDDNPFAAISHIRLIDTVIARGIVHDAPARTELRRQAVETLGAEWRAATP